MKALFACTFALAVTTAAIGWADRAAADEPFELSPTQLDRVSAGSHVSGSGSLVIEGGELSLVLNKPGDRIEQTLTFPESRHDNAWGGVRIWDYSDPASPR